MLSLAALISFATLLGLFPQGYELPHAVIRGRSSLREAGPRSNAVPVTGAAPVTGNELGAPPTDAAGARPFTGEMANR